ncbi:cryptochrome/photolyase family protein [Parvicella tangerina]|uniref:Deoxyribodipyrimidine photo-lyase n=1 Tax=Parvicella tangerina TaxID=2829795 RepID=A0A916JKG7_9FLAO|nr:deoxyribodipyrimidine photo-lyase [Parvicella tangerina]CAG5078943.1 Deoxyribodipyrimidine photo-lyase [Parvicella tangerina]
MTIFWFRRDLRLEDNAGLYYALKESKEVQPIFIFDTTILDRLNSNKDARVNFIYNAVKKLKHELQHLGSDLKVYHGKPADILATLIKENIDAIFTNRDYEPEAIDRDKTIYELCQKNGVKFIAKKDQVIFDRNEILKTDGTPYTVYTPYSKKWKAKLNEFYTAPYPTLNYSQNLKKVSSEDMISMSKLGFEPADTVPETPSIPTSVISNYHETRDIPAIQGTSRLSVHLRFGTVSIRKLTRIALEHNEKWLNELIWRDFYQMIMYHFPHSKDQAFKPKYDLIEWENNEAHFKAWCEGKTGYPIVDAGMRELNTTGFMHNRVRMIVASFLTKHLLIDWRWGERYFAEKLLDFDLASNVGGWQWAAGSGCDAAPYFRVFNPYLQTEKFDPDEKYIMKWVPEYQGKDYPDPIVIHKEARQRALERYKLALN